MLAQIAGMSGLGPMMGGGSGSGTTGGMAPLANPMGRGMSGGYDGMGSAATARFDDWDNGSASGMANCGSCLSCNLEDTNVAIAYALAHSRIAYERPCSFAVSCVLCLGLKAITVRIFYG